MRYNSKETPNGVAVIRPNRYQVVDSYHGICGHQHKTCEAAYRCLARQRKDFKNNRFGIQNFSALVYYNDFGTIVPFPIVTTGEPRCGV